MDVVKWKGTNLGVIPVAWMEIIWKEQKKKALQDNAKHTEREVNSLSILPESYNLQPPI